MFTDLTDAINVMTVYVTENPNNRTMAKYDKVYDGDFEKWVKFANSLKLRMAIRIRFADREYARQMAEEAINHSIGVITSNEDNATSLGTKNQLYTVLVQWPDQCVSADITSYMKGYNDPRMSKYFKKKTIKRRECNVGLHGGRKQCCCKEKKRKTPLPKSARCKISQYPQDTKTESAFWPAGYNLCCGCAVYCVRNPV